jgi:hypothetical protein
MLNCEAYIKSTKDKISFREAIKTAAFAGNFEILEFIIKLAKDKFKLKLIDTDLFRDIFLAACNEKQL